MYTKPFSELISWKYTNEILLNLLVKTMQIYKCYSLYVTRIRGKWSTQEERLSSRSGVVAQDILQRLRDPGSNITCISDYFFDLACNCQFVFFYGGISCMYTEIPAGYRKAAIDGLNYSDVTMRYHFACRIFQVQTHLTVANHGRILESNI